MEEIEEIEEEVEDVDVEEYVRDLLGLGVPNVEAMDVDDEE